jgi:hypothetical protein
MFGKDSDMSMFERVDLFGCKQPLQRDECSDLEYFLFSQQPASQTLKEIELFLVANPTEIIIIFIEDYVQVPNGVSEVFTNAGLKQFWFPVSKMPKTGGDWPTVDEMIQTNQRLLVFTSVESKEESEGIAYEWNYMVENMCEYTDYIQVES